MREFEMTTQQMNLLAVTSIAVCWCAFAATWGAAANYNEGRAPAERTRSWFGTAVLPGVIIVTAISFAVPKPDWRALTFYIPSVRILGLVILLAATALTIWARLVLGVMWSAAPTVKDRHELRTSGPYGITRHPIYTGLLGMLLGSVLVAGGGRLIAAFPVSLVLVEIKIRIEERLMLGEFPDDYPRYRRQVPQLVPGLRLISERARLRPRVPSGRPGY
jgi:protein-S-isoprenylcysteine O-methyltransferase Ste14